LHAACLHRVACSPKACAQGEAAPALASVADAAASAAKMFIAARDIFHSDLLDMSAVKHLQGDATHGKVHRLLSIFLTGARLATLRLLEPSRAHAVRVEQASCPITSPSTKRTRPLSQLAACRTTTASPRCASCR